MITEPSTRAENIRGALFMMASMATFVVNDTLVKSLAGDVPLMQVVFARGLLVLALITGFILYRGGISLRAIAPRDRLLILARSGSEALATFCTMKALFSMQIANFTAITLTAPLMLTLIGAVFFREPVGWRRWAAVITGFGGVLLIVKPGAEGFNEASLWAVTSVILVCIRDLFTRRLSREVKSLAVTLVNVLTITTFAGLITLIQGWEPISATAGTRIFFAAFFVLGGYIFSVMAMRSGDIAFVSPFRYTNMVWALALGFLVFGDIPGTLSLLGAALVVLAGIYMFLLPSRPIR